MGDLAGAWSAIGAAAWGAGALACAVAAVWLESRRGGYGAARRAVVSALALTALWAASGACGAAWTGLAEVGRDLGWIFALYRLFAVDGRHASMMQVRPMIAALGFAELLQGAVQGVLLAGARTLPGAPGLHLAVLLDLLVAIGGLVLVHNLYGGASSLARTVLRWPALALGLLWGYDLNFGTVAYLSGSVPAGFAALRGATALGLGALLAFGAIRGGEQLRFRPSRSVTFQSLSLLLIGGYLVTMGAAARGLAYAGGDLAEASQRGFVALVLAFALMILPSRRLRGWLRVMLAKHLFQHRYDYRSEWLRFTRTIAQGSGSEASLDERVIRALADITESPAGLLLTPGDRGQLELAARWAWPTLEVPAEAAPSEATRAVEASGYIADLDQLRAGRAEMAPPFAVPQWLVEEPRAWALVPLLHFERLVGLVVLARPALARPLDWEDFDLLRVAGQQLASYLAEHTGQEALAEAARFDDFHRRIAFVIHDLKNLASQFNLLARNAEQYSENPEFRADMLVTLRSSADKLSALLARLSRYGAMTVEALMPVRADLVAAEVAAQFEARCDGRRPVTVIEAEECVVLAARESLEQVLAHLVQNALDASAEPLPVFIRVGTQGASGVIDVLDSGTGMSPEFVRNRLFRPFDSTKSGGFGIGAYEARELVRAMKGRLDVESRETIGSRFTIRLPLAEAAQILQSLAGQAGSKVA